jgi:putative ATPase
MNIPLADRIRPAKLSEIVGQEHILGVGRLLTKAIESKQLFSMILWGPPGVGKTTLARAIANELETDFIEFSAVTTSTVELKKLFQEIKESQDSGITRMKSAPVIFIDEIHRFNKAQQDAFLPFVENGTITLIGATTENPSFEIIPPLLSRSRVFVLKQLEHEHLSQMINHALSDKDKGLGKFKKKIKADAIDFLIEGSNGDGRRVLNTLEIAVLASDNKTLTKEDIEEALQQKALRYDKDSDEHYDTISAFIKSMRASHVDAALYYLARMVDAGEDPLFIARRMVVFASEDIGLAQPTAVVVANEVFRACEFIGYPECQINLAHGVAYLASAKKDRSAYDAYMSALEDVKQYGNLPIPLKIRNAPTKLMKSLDYGKGYQMYGDNELLPDKLKGKKYLKIK